MQKFNFVTDGSVVYRLADNDWYAVEQDDNKVMLIDTDCKIGDEKLETHWSDGDWTSKEGENGEAVLDYCNNLVDTYFSGIKHVITPRTVNAGTSELENALMWPMSKEEFKEHRNIGGKIVENSGSNVWTRTFNGIGSYNNRYAWVVSSTDGALGNGIVNSEFCVAPAFYLKKSAIDHIEENGKVILDNPQTLAKKTAKEYEILLYNAILSWYDDNINTYYGLDDPDFIDMVCGKLGLSLDEYFCLVLEF